MNKIIFEGVATALFTPIKNNRVNYSSLKKNILRQLENGIDALVVLGTTGEPYTLSSYEKDKILDVTLQTVNGGLPVIVGVGNNCTAQTIKNLKRAENMGTENFLVITPYVNKCTQKGLVYHFEKICDSTQNNVILYDVPGRTGVKVSLSAFSALSLIPNLCGIKLSYGNLENSCLIADMMKNKTAVYSGDDALNARLYLKGANGCISVTSNLIPETIKRIYNLYKNGKIKDCLDLSENISDLNEVLFENVNPIPLKYAANLMGLCAGDCRPPLSSPDEIVKKHIEKALKNHGILKENDIQ